MGTVPFNFPPDATMDIGGQILTGTSLNNTGPLLPTVFFTAPTAGVYQCGAMIHITQTDGAGTLTVSMTPPLQIAQTNTNAGAISDVSVGSRGAFFHQGAQLTCSVSAAGLGATTYNVYAFALRVF
jgi:hypothetical protein